MNNIFGYIFSYNKLSYKEQLSFEETCILPTFGFGYWTFNNPVWSRVSSLREKRKVIAKEQGLYIHIWLFNYRFDFDFRKTIKG